MQPLPWSHCHSCLAAIDHRAVSALRGDHHFSRTASSGTARHQTTACTRTVGRPGDGVGERDG